MCNRVPAGRPKVRPLERPSPPDSSARAESATRRRADALQTSRAAARTPKSGSLARCAVFGRHIIASNGRSTRTQRQQSRGRRASPPRTRRRAFRAVAVPGALPLTSVKENVSMSADTSTKARKPFTNDHGSVTDRGRPSPNTSRAPRRPRLGAAAGPRTATNQNYPRHTKGAAGRRGVVAGRVQRLEENYRCVAAPRSPPRDGRVLEGVRGPSALRKRVPRRRRGLRAAATGLGPRGAALPRRAGRRRRREQA